MSYAYLLAGEDLRLAEDELRGFLRSQKIEPEIERFGRLAIEPAEPSQLRRLALIHEVSRVVARGNLDDIDPVPPEGSFAVRAVDLDGEFSKKELEQELGRKLGTDENRVDLENPSTEYRAYFRDEEILLGELVDDIPRGLFERRKNQNRPFSSPVSLDPVTARVLVNLSEVPPGGNILDPFCGTGGILLEAGLCGIGVHGLDVQEEMVEGCRENLEWSGIITHDIRAGDVREAENIFDRKFDAVVTDVPYGKASKIENEPVEAFLESALNLSRGKVVFMSDQEQVGEYEPRYEIYVHKNLTRYVYVL